MLGSSKPKTLNYTIFYLINQQFATKGCQEHHQLQIEVLKFVIHLARKYMWNGLNKNKSVFLYLKSRYCNIIPETPYMYMKFINYHGKELNEIHGNLIPMKIFIHAIQYKLLQHTYITKAYLITGQPS